MRPSAAEVLDRLREGNRVFASDPHPSAARVAPCGSPRLAVVVVEAAIETLLEPLLGLGYGELVVARAPDLVISDAIAGRVELGVRADGIDVVIVVASSTSDRADDRTDAGRRARDAGEVLRALLDPPSRVAIVPGVIGPSGGLDLL
jgi:hypothetical protein